MSQILFEKPNIPKLKKDGYLCVDMHFHSTFSDGAANINEIILKATSLGIGVSITDHNVIEGSLEAVKKYKWVVPGIEIKSRELIDILFYFYDANEMRYFFKKNVEPFKVNYLIKWTRTTIPLKDIMIMGDSYKCIMSVAHPFGYALRVSITDLFEKYEKILEMYDVFEAINGGNNRNQNISAIRYIQKNKKAYTGGTDGHSITPLGNVVTCAKARDISNFLDCIKSQKNLVLGTDRVTGKFGEYREFTVNKIKKMLR
jgi:hypothetical protein